MDIALSPCPNDTFLFFPWILGYVGKELPINPHYYDIQQLNEFALQANFPLTKLSISTWGKVQNRYDLLSIGAALGYHQGPKIIAKTPFSQEVLSQLKIAVPGRDTTAHLLIQLLFPEMKQKRFCLYHEVQELIERQEVDCGLIIHETRFTFQESGLYEIADLGKLYCERTGMPLPLGGLVVKKELPEKELICAILRESLDFARTHPEKGMDFILSKSREKSESVVKEHIALYVNEETAELSAYGKEAINLFLDKTKSLH